MFEFILIWFVSFWICVFVTLLRPFLPTPTVWLPEYQHPTAASIIPVANFVYAIYNLLTLTVYVYDYTKGGNEMV